MVEAIWPGVDSFVFHNGENVYKYYSVRKGTPHELTLLDIQNYQRLTNAVSRYYEETGMVHRVRDTKLDLKIEVNPIDEVFWHEGKGCAVAVSKYVGGISYPSLISCSKNSEFLRSNGITDVESLEKMWCDIYQLGKDLNEVFKFEIVALASINAKFFLCEETPRLVITDLCSTLSEIKWLSS